MFLNHPYAPVNMALQLHSYIGSAYEKSFECILWLTKPHTLLLDGEAEKAIQKLISNQIYQQQFDNLKNPNTKQNNTQKILKGINNVLLQTWLLGMLSVVAS